jgi:hypothetical protein
MGGSEFDPVSPETYRCAQILIFFVAPTYDGDESVRSIRLLQDALQGNLSCIHQRRQAAVWRAVAGVIAGGQLCLTQLGRALPANTTDKHRIKAVDRLLGNRALHREVETFYRALARWLLRGIRCPVVAVDWTGAGRYHYELSAKLCCDGRALPLYSCVFPKKLLASRVAHRKFLAELAGILPIDCRPILVTDAGFHFTWFDEVTWFGWHYIGRVRGRSDAFFMGRWQRVKRLHRYATRRPKDLGVLWVPFNKTDQHRLILSARPKPKGRRRWTKRGTRGRNATDIKSAKRAAEPWLLATSLRSSAKFIVHAYGMRMQIEQSFRDRKNHRNGWSMHHVHTRSAERLSVIVLLASLAEVVVQLVGRAVGSTAHATQFQANTTRRRRVLSFFFIGCRAVARDICPTHSQLQTALRECTSVLWTIAQKFEPI